MATSLLSLALNKPLDPTIAMTGELTVTGKVLRIGGLREKTVAARRAGAKSIIFPADNTSDWLELPEVWHRYDPHSMSQELIVRRTSRRESKGIRQVGTPKSSTSSSPISTKNRPATFGRSS